MPRLIPFTPKPDEALAGTLDALDLAFEGGMDTCVLAERLLTGESFSEDERAALLFVVRERYRAFAGMRETVAEQRRSRE